MAGNFRRHHDRDKKQGYAQDGPGPAEQAIFEYCEHAFHPIYPPIAVYSRLSRKPAKKAVISRSKIDW